jgi:hypothetical protein
MIRARWPWITMIVALAVVNLFVWGTRVGECVDYAANAGKESFCTSGPSVGYPGAWAVSAISVLVAAYCVYRLARRPSVAG